METTFLSRPSHLYTSTPLSYFIGDFPLMDAAGDSQQQSGHTSEGCEAVCLAVLNRKVYQAVCVPQACFFPIHALECYLLVFHCHRTSDGEGVTA